MKRLKLPIKDKKELKGYRSGEEILIEGILYTARDKVHSLTAAGKGAWPFRLRNNGIYYCGPTPANRNFPFGSCGPTTSARMDKYTPGLYKKGLAVTVGKGPRNTGVVNSIKKNGGLYLAAYGGCGALYGSRIVSAEAAGFKELGPQAVYRIEVMDFPVIVGIDSSGRNIFEKI